MDLAKLSLSDQAVIASAALILFTSFVMLAQTRIRPLIYAFAWQGALLALITALVAAASKHPHLYISALLTLALKALLIPWMLNRLSTRLNIHHDVEASANPSLMLLIGGALVIFSY